MLFDLLLTKDTHDRALWHLFSVCTNTAASQNFSPNVSEVSIFPTLPTRLIRLLDIQARLEGIAMRNFRAAVDGRLVFVAYRRCGGLSGKQERVGVRFARVDDGESEESDYGNGDQGGVEVPVREGAGDLLIEGFEKDWHVDVFSAGKRGWLRAREL